MAVRVIAHQRGDSQEQSRLPYLGDTGERGTSPRGYSRSKATWVHGYTCYRRRSVDGRNDSHCVAGPLRPPSVSVDLQTGCAHRTQL